MKKNIVRFLALAFAALLPRIAMADTFSNTTSYSQVNPPSGSSVSDNGSTSSSASIDANDYAHSFITPGTSIMGAAVSADPAVSLSPLTNTVHDDSWWFNCDAQHVCGSIGVAGIPIRITFGIDVSETKVTDDSYLEFDANYQLQNSGTFRFSFAQDGPGDFELQASYVDASGTVTPLTVGQTLNGGVYSLTVDATLHDTVCGFGSVCIPEDMSCQSGTNCSSTPAFTDEQSIKALIDSDSSGVLNMIDGYDPFSIDIVSLDPNYQFISADGRVIPSVASNPPGGGVPEPLTLSLFGTGLAGAVALRRRKTKA